MMHDHGAGSSKLAARVVGASCHGVTTLQVKMVTSDDEATTDIIVEGDQEEITRMTKELVLQVSTRLCVNAVWLLAGGEHAFIRTPSLTRTCACRKRARCA